jgi:hypothetical protein
MAAFTDVASLLGGIVEEPLFLSNNNVMVSPGENPSSSYLERAMVASSSLPS